ncbi:MULTISPECIES: MFS transporter [Streptomyces]|uniref:Predicted arabinose efflux permease, MFS family n=1 Tax=Streptomyces mirabilis TaxID=68239 RepID=A0A1I2GM58_9ACTN|nr:MULTISPECIES: MFS transporter [Streptomyces]NMI57158.1 MFS transporter [Streptomyces sp. RLA2-12]QDN56529.1 MFS transporter [Streptomyces sp. S1D4-20]QDN66706.1 MFS transporter [Streptomyces sp. S1D4-14]QDN76953.1 MFS transporter [Streptomyces sp. S1A1-7]QDN97321.1 MFS transporter [Streptomyces sp. RLB1-9]
MAAGYLEILRARHAARLLAGTLTGRLPNATAAIAVVLFVRAEGGTYSLAGALAAVYGVGNAVGQPLLGRLVDLYGQPRVQLPAALVSALGMGVFAFSGTDPLPVAYLSMVVAGLFTPPLEGGLRALWPSVLRREEQVHTAYAMDAVAQEVMFTVGPLLLTLCASLWSARAALLILNVVGVLGALSVVLSPPSRAWRSAPREAHWLGALRSPGLLALLGAFLFVGIALGSITVAAVSYADDHGGDAVYGWLMAAVGLGALVGGTAYGARRWSGAPERRLRVLVALLAVCYLPLVLMPGVVAMTALAALAGVFLAPCIACAFIIVDRHAPRGTVTEAFSWLVTTFTVGASVGTGLAGPVVEWGGAVWGFALPGAAGAAALVVLLATGRVLAATGDGAVVAVSSENDPNRAVEPRFSSGDRA